MRLLSTSYVLSFLSLAALSAAGNSTNTNHYQTGPVEAVFTQLDLSADGVVSLGMDGVLRSFNSKGEVIDYAQLDPSQISAFASHQLNVWDRSDKDTPETVVNLAQAQGVDGRAVTDINALLHPKGATNPSQARSEPTRRQPLHQRGPSACLSEPCFTSEQCLATEGGCLSCVTYIAGTEGYCMGGIIT